MAIWVDDARTNEKKLVCGKKTDEGGLCMSYPLKGRKYCRHHQYMGPSGPDHHNFIHGKYTPLLRRDLIYAYTNSIQAEDPFSMRDELGLIDARLSMLAQDLDLADGQGLKDQVFELKNWIHEMYGKNQVDGTAIDLNEVQDRLDRILANAENERKRWSEIYDVIDFRRKLVESEHRRMLDSQKMVTEKEFMTMIAFLLNIIKKHIHDQSLLNTISAEIIENGSIVSSRVIEVQPG